LRNFVAQLRQTNKNMKKLLILTTLLFLGLVSCEKIDNMTQFHVNYDANLYIPDNLPTDTLIHLEESSMIILPEDYEVNTTTKDLLENVELKELIIKSNDSIVDFDFLTDIEIYIQAVDLPKIRIAWKNDIPNGLGNELELETLSDNVSEYLKADRVMISADIKTDEELAEPLSVNVYFDFLVDAKVLGL